MPQRETILVVDDEAGIRSLIVKILRREHYRVLEAGTATGGRGARGNARKRRSGFWSRT